MHCGACHTPKNLAGGDKTGESLQGYTLGWFSRQIDCTTRGVALVAGALDEPYRVFENRP